MLFGATSSAAHWVDNLKVTSADGAVTFLEDDFESDRDWSQNGGDNACTVSGIRSGRLECRSDWCALVNHTLQVPLASGLSLSAEVHWSEAGGSVAFGYNLGVTGTPCRMCGGQCFQRTGWFFSGLGTKDVGEISFGAPELQDAVPVPVSARPLPGSDHQLRVDVTVTNLQN